MRATEQVVLTSASKILLKEFVGFVIDMKMSGSSIETESFPTFDTVRHSLGDRAFWPQLYIFPLHPFPQRLQYGQRLLRAPYFDLLLIESQFLTFFFYFI